MHYHCEIIMPPVDNPHDVVEQVLAPFSEHFEDNNIAFWDWYQVGGRWAGTKAKHTLDPTRLSEFMDHLIELGITVSPVSMGKQTLKPESQEYEVDQLWNEWFPESGLHQCPLFTHAGNQLTQDICSLSECPKDLTAARIIVAVYRPPSEYRHVGRYEAQTMLTEEFWNGVNFQHSRETCSITEALALHAKQIRNMRDDLVEAYTPNPDWLVVTVDYHS